MTDNLPTPELLRKLLSYDPDTGKLFWKKRDVSLFPNGGLSALGAMNVWNGKNAGKETSVATNSRGYKLVSIFGKKYVAHRVIWCMDRGVWPDEIDHINGDTCDNRLTNLRSVSHAENSRNRKTPTSNTSGRVGVYWDKRNKKWLAQINYDRRPKFLGLFTRFDDAVSARKEAELAFGFHENHGR